MGYPHETARNLVGILPQTAGIAAMASLRSLRQHATDDEGLLAGIAESLQGRVKRRVVTCDITLGEQRDRRDHQTRAEKRHCVC